MSVSVGLPDSNRKPMIGLRRDDIPCGRRSAISACASGARQGPGRNVRRSGLIVSRRTAPPNDSGIQRTARSASRSVCGTHGTIGQERGSVVSGGSLPDAGRRESYGLVRTRSTPQGAMAGIVTSVTSVVDRETRFPLSVQVIYCRKNGICTCGNACSKPIV